MISLKFAPDAFKGLNGVFCVFKPVGIGVTAVRKTLVFNLCRDLNELTPRQSDDVVCLEGSVYSQKPFEVQLSPNLAQHKLVSGPHYQPQNIRLKWVSSLGINTSGIVLMAVNDGCKLPNKDFHYSYLRKYVIEGKFGLATDNFMEAGKVIEKTSFYHVKKSSFEKVLSSIVASHQSLKYDYLGINIESQAAYDLASKGLIKVSTRTQPILFHIKCVKFKLPDFTLELQCLNETEEFLTELVHDMGIDLKTNAVCKELRRVQYGHFTLCHALLRKHWTLANILNNVALCSTMLEEAAKGSADSHCVKKIQQSLIEAMQMKVREEHMD